MTQEEAKRLPFMDFTPDQKLEDCFYYKMYQEGRLSAEQGRKAVERIGKMQKDAGLEEYMALADIMIENLDRYGVACAAWCDGTPTPRKKLREMYVSNVNRDNLSREQVVYILGEEIVKKVEGLDCLHSDRGFFSFPPDMRDADVEEFTSTLSTPKLKLMAYYYQPCDDYAKGIRMENKAHHYSITYWEEAE